MALPRYIRALAILSCLLILSVGFLVFRSPGSLHIPVKGEKVWEEMTSDPNFERKVGHSL